MGKSHTHGNGQTLIDVEADPAVDDEPNAFAIARGLRTWVGDLVWAATVPAPGWEVQAVETENYSNTYIYRSHLHCYLLYNPPPNSGLPPKNGPTWERWTHLFFCPSWLEISVEINLAI